MEVGPLNPENMVRKILATENGGDIIVNMVTGIIGANIAEGT